MKRGEANVPVIVLSVFALVTIGLVASFVYMSLNGHDYSSEYNKKIESGEIQNPVEEFALEFSEGETSEGAQVIKIQTEEGEKHIIIQANLGDLNTADIEKELVTYGAVVLKLYNLHKIPFIGTTPKVQIYVDNKSYYAEITKGNIIIKDGKANKEDIAIRTTHEEIFKMIEDSSYAGESLSSGKTSIEMVANKFVLFAKGYLTLYNEFNSISGSVIKAL